MVKGKQSDKKLDIIADVNAIPIEEIPFINETTHEFLVPVAAKKLNFKGEESLVYDVQVLCPNLEQYIMRNKTLVFADSNDKGGSLTYAYIDGYYQNLTEDVFKSLIAYEIPWQIRKNKDIEEVYGLLKKERSLHRPELEMRSNEDYICFKNGLLNVKTREFNEKHDKNIITTIQIPVDYKPLKECKNNGVFDKFINELVSGNEVTKQVLLEFMGIAISNWQIQRIKKSLIMVGDKDCGKSVVKKLVSRIIGSEYTSSLELSALNGDKFACSEVYNKRIVGSNDMQYSPSKDMGVFKQLTGGDFVRVEFKGRTGFSYIYPGVLWFLTNKLPQFSGDKTNTVYERIMIIPCKHVVPKNEQDPFLIDKLLEESEYIVSLCVESLYDFFDRGCEFIESEEMLKAREFYKVENNSILQFVEEYCDVLIKPEETLVGDELREYKRLEDIYVKDRVSISQFKKNYAKWCEHNGTSQLKCANDILISYLRDRYGTEKVKSGTEKLSNIKMKDTWEQDFGFIPSVKKD